MARPPPGSKGLRTSRLTPDEVKKAFSPDQVHLWTPGWRPLVSTATFIHRDGVKLGDLITTRKDLADSDNSLNHDFMVETRAISSLRVKSLAQSVQNCGRQKRLMKKVLSRDRCPKYNEVAEFFQLREHAKTARAYRWNNYANVQDFSLLPLRACKNMDSKVFLPTFGALRNLLHADYDSLSAMKALFECSGDNLVYTKEFVSEMAHYLARRLEEIAPEKKAPILIFFEGSGRLAHLLNETELLPVRVISALHRDFVRPLWDRRFDFPEELPSTFRTEFHVENIEVTDALVKYDPCLCIAGPHSDRDYLCDLRGYRSVREVITMGPVDSPSMASFNFPWLSFGCVAGPDTYYHISDKLTKMDMGASLRKSGPPPSDYGGKISKKGPQHPVDPPYVLQGYKRVWVDEISRFLISTNDTYHQPYQARCLSFIRVEEPRFHSDANLVGGDDTSAADANSNNGGQKQKERIPDVLPTAGKPLDGVVIAGCSGVGKGTLIKKLMGEFPGQFGFSVSHTTRGPRQGEVDGKDYHFTTREAMTEDIAEGKFIENCDVHGNMYGTSKKAVEDVRDSGAVCVFDLDVQGVEKFHDACKADPEGLGKMNFLYLFVNAPSIDDLEKRITGRGQETPDKIKTRLGTAEKEMAFLASEKGAACFDVVLLNDDFDVAYGKFKKLLVEDAEKQGVEKTEAAV